MSSRELPSLRSHGCHLLPVNLQAYLGVHQAGANLQVLEAGGVMVGNDIKINLDVQAVTA